MPEPASASANRGPGVVNSRSWLAGRPAQPGRPERAPVHRHRPPRADPADRVAASSGSRCPSARVGPQPPTGTSARSTGSTSARSSRSSVSPGYQHEPASLPTRKPRAGGRYRPAGADGRRGWRPAPRCGRRPARPRRPGTTGTSRSGPGRPAGARRRAATTSGTSGRTGPATAGGSGRGAGARSSTRSASAAAGAGVAAYRTRWRSRSTSSGSVATRVPPSSTVPVGVAPPGAADHVTGRRRCHDSVTYDVSQPMPR